MPTLQYDDNNHLAYHSLSATGNGPGVIYLHGLMSSMDAIKALFLEDYCNKSNRAFIRFDYFGHGNSSGDFQNGNIGIWLDNVLQIIDKLTTGPQILVGSSLGGWLMCLAALQRSERICGLLGIAASIDFTEKLMWQNFSADIKQQLETNGIYYMPSNYGEPYPITMQLIQNARNYLLMHNKININCPIELVHGSNDAIVPWQHSMHLVEKFTSNNVTVTIKKGSGHSFSEENDLELLAASLERLYNY